MQHWSIYLTMSHECNWGPSTWIISLLYQFVLTARLQNDPVERRLGQYRQMSDGRFSISAKGYVRENIENHEPSERMIWHQLVCQNSKHSGEAENNVLLDAESFLGDIDSITLNETSTNVSDHVAGCITAYVCHKETEALWRMLRSTSLVLWTKLCEQRYTLHGRSE